jgi:DNA-binding response OmpR family regulator
VRFKDTSFALCRRPGIAIFPAMTRALIADDDPTIVLLLEHVFQALGREHDTAVDGAAAWDSWQMKRHPLVVLDIEMPKMDGLEVCRRIRAAEPDRKTYILVVTGRDRAADLEAVLEAGADDYVTKPTSGQRLLARLRIAERRMQQDAARRDAVEQLQQARFMAGIGQATVGLQHEINNPLTGLLGTAELMLMDLQDKGQSTDDIRIILEQGRRISALVKKLGDLRDPKSVHYAGGKHMIDLAVGEHEA